MSTERQVAEKLANEARVNKILARTGGELMHPDHYDLREEIRLSVLAAIDDTCKERFGKRIMSDAELPELFKTLDAISNRMFLSSVGLG